MLIRFTCALLLFLTNVFLMAKEQESYQYIQDTKKLVQRVVPALEKELGLVCVGDGGMLLKDVSGISVEFNAARRATVEEARQLHVLCTEKLLEAVNRDINLRPYLAEYPFPAHRVEISISFHDNRELSYADGTVSYMFQTRGNICYYLDHSIYQIREPFLREPYSQALGIVQAAPKTNAELRVHQEKPYEKALDAFWASAGDAIQKQWKTARVRFGGDMSDGIKEFSFLFYKYKKVNVAEARKLEVEIVNMLLDKINTNADLRPYLKEYPVKPEHIQVLIEFKGSDGYDQEGEDRLSSVSHQNKVIQYCIRESSNKEAWSTQPILVKTESYEEASQLLKGKKPSAL